MADDIRDLNVGLVTRYLIDSSSFSVLNNRVKPRSLEPRDEIGQTSVFKIHGQSENDIWDQGRLYVSEPRHKELRARADIHVHTITKLDLSVVDDEPPPRHAYIADWPARKDERMAIAQLLAAEATLHLIP